MTVVAQIHDLRFDLRQLLKNPDSTAVAVLALALGIGANTAVPNFAFGQNQTLFQDV